VPARAGWLRGAEVAHDATLPWAGPAVACHSLQGACPECVTLADAGLVD
jgi:hypothetical protein